jgi:hypothetical protein
MNKLNYVLLTGFIIVIIIIYFTLPENQQVIITVIEDKKNVKSEEPINPLQTKQYYNKLDEITLPSSYSPYITRDHVCYRDMRHNEAHLAQNGGCIACQVDNTDEWKTANYDNTMTNVISACVYDPKKTTDSENNEEPWSRNKCVKECSK